MFSDNGRTKADVDHPVPGISWHPVYLHCSQVENTNIESFETYTLFSIYDLENVATSQMTKEEVEAKQVITKLKCSKVLHGSQNSQNGNVEASIFRGTPCFSFPPGPRLASSNVQ